ncbi:MAG: ATP-binding protein [Stellaceae bacterium]
MVSTPPGAPTAERGKVTERFYRLDRSRSLPGNGLGLAIVNAVADLHGGSFQLVHAGPGLIARIVLPRLDAETVPNRNFAVSAETDQPL